MTPEERASKTARLIEAEFHGKECGLSKYVAILADIKAAVAEEREACAVIAEAAWEDDCGKYRGITEVHDLIRARSKS